MQISWILLVIYTVTGENNAATNKTVQLTLETYTSSWFWYDSDAELHAECASNDILSFILKVACSNLVLLLDSSKIQNAGMIRVLNHTVMSAYEKVTIQRVLIFYRCGISIL